jgi:hypothetical protein
VHVTWTSSVSGTSQIFYRHFGEAWEEAIQVTNTPVESAFSGLAIDRSGELHFAWMEDSGGSYDIVHQIGLSAQEVNLVSSKR